MSLNVIADLRSAQADLMATWAARFSGTDGPPTVARELLNDVIDGLDIEHNQQHTKLSAAIALGVLRAQQGHSATSLVEDVLSLRPILWGHVAITGGAPEDHLAILLLVQDRLTALLDLAVRNAVAAFVDESTRVLARQATRDVLTGLANRAVLEDTLDRELAGADRDGGPALLIIDLDRFKQVNDTLGHLAGDDILVEVAAAIQSACRANDLAARLGGDEFAVVLPKTGEEQAQKIARRVLKAIAKSRKIAKLDVPVGASIGLGTTDEPVGRRELLATTDAALYRAKRVEGDAIEVVQGIDRASARASLTSEAA